MKESSVAEQSARPPTTGKSDRLTISDVRSPRIIRAKITVKNGADDLIVSVKETATNLRLSKPAIMVAKRITPTSSISNTKFRHGCEESGES